jgi:hypothetical protein
MMFCSTVNLDPTFFSFIAVKSASYRRVQGMSADSSLMVTAKTSSPLWERIEVTVTLSPRGPQGERELSLDDRPEKQDVLSNQR